MPSTRRTDLYGGAITASLPADFADVSAIRDVPDHQEVYLSRTGLSSIIFDIVERPEPPEHPASTDVEMLKYHFEDAITPDLGSKAERGGAGDEDTRTWSVAPAIFSELPGKPAYTMFATRHPKTSVTVMDSTSNNTTAGSAPPPDFTALLFTLLRLPDQKTDILITINVPHTPGEHGYDPSSIDLPAGANGTLIDEAMGIRTEVLKTFTVVDWGLFVN